MRNGKKKLPSFMALVLALVMVLALASPISAYAQTTNDEVILNDETGIPDKVLYDYLVRDLGHDGVLRASDLAGMRGIEQMAGRVYTGITSLKGLERCTNLEFVLLWGNNISDISALSGLTNLRELCLGNNNISDISALSGLTNLTYLDLYNNKIADFSPIDSLNATVIGRDYQSPVVDNSQGSTGGNTGGTTGGATGGNTAGATGGSTGGNTNGTVGGNKNDVVNDVKDTLSSIETGTKAKEYLADLDKTTLVNGLQSDKELVTQVAKVEAKYVEEKNIEVKAPAVSDEVKKLINKDSIKVVGAGLNADANSTVEFSVSVPAAKVNVADTYHNAVALDLKLFVNGTSKSNLDVPVSITMDAPAGVSTSNLVILHYHDGSATPEVITPVVNEDGTITFAVSGFSTFVFANTVASSYYDYISSPNGGEISPKTGESANAAVIMLAISVAAVVVVRRKVTVK